MRKPIKIMCNFIKSILILIFIMLLQLFIYDFFLKLIFLKPVITTWGVSKKEITLPMAGDNKALTITGTRAIWINTSKLEVWKCLIQLGAYRSGFYSYSFLEKIMGKTRPKNLIHAEFKGIAVGDVIRGSIDERNSVIPYNFRVLYVKPEETFVLDRWGTFLLKKLSNQQTCLIIRTQEVKSSDPWLNMANYIMIPLHFIMERRMLMGIKALAETKKNVQPSQMADLFWFAGIVLSVFVFILFR